MAKKNTENTKTNLLEELYLDSGNSGMTLRILEKIKTWKSPVSEKECRDISYRVEVQHGAFGQHSTMSFPLGSPKMARYILGAIQRTVAHIDAATTDEDWKYSPFDRLTDKHVYGVRGGLRSSSVYRVEIVTSEYGTLAEFLGTDWRDASGKIVYFEPAKETGTGYGKGGTEKSYYPDEIGLPVSEVAERRKGTDRNQIKHVRGFSGRVVPIGVDPADIWEPF